MTDLVKRLQELREKATPGPWEWQWRSGDENAPASICTKTHYGAMSAIAMCPRYGAKVFPDDAALICELVNNLDTIISALSGIEGMVLVPREPTEEMLEAGVNRWDTHHPAADETYPNERATYRAMIAVAPSLTFSPIKEGV